MEETLRMRQDNYSGHLKVYGEESERTLISASNYAATFLALERLEEARSMLRKTIPVARRVLGEGHDLTLRMRTIYAQAIYSDPDATLDDLRETVSTLEETARTARRVLGAAHPIGGIIEDCLRQSREVLAARETPPTSA